MSEKLFTEQDVLDIIGGDVGHGNFHCGVELCCGKNTKAKQHSTEISDAECKVINQAKIEQRARLITLIFKQNE